ncbi:uncharacterized protein BCR38DRAFT_103170 [Pseudomassariella vexata]|uniref:Uncharacterized protein n=1 Tax=Pseudomassariella vexata TaxID=1141098 RepID=A0A1Y2EFR4_9PEZI|nr:uncharacterized protein BCR38DRAFT_103170 [Pseudomassariella vexata]ORY70257.1 hypothetical protein BCR38DRAFT_103170 [Pseudomassariella vexata]
MILPHRSPLVLRSIDNDLSLRRVFRRSNDKGPTQGYLIIIGIVVVAIVAIAGIFICARRKNRANNGKKRGGYQQTDGNERVSSRYSAALARALQPPPNFDTAISEANRARERQATVDRNTSIRSIMTLPAYRTKANENERVLGREGERDGVDVVVELPNAEEEEALRENEMETMYRIRLARRQAIEEREERRRLRREARDRGDMVALAELSQRQSAASHSSTVEELREEQERIRIQRQQAVSSVSYADLGVARLDGTRLRANSAESERVGLLSDAASITLSTHRRERSASSVLSFDSNQEFPSPGLPRCSATTPQLQAQHTGGSQRSGRAGSSPEMIEADLGDEGMPPHSPPGYDDVSLDDTPRSGATTPLFNEPPPEYSGPTMRDRRLSAHAPSMMHSPDLDDGDLSRRSSHTSAGPSARSSRGVGGAPQLPSLRLTTGLPQIIVEPSSAHPRSRSGSEQR